MSGIKYLLDTNIIIGLYQYNITVLELPGKQQVSIEQCTYSAITRIELLSYPDITSSDKQTIESLLKQMQYLAVTTEIEDETIIFRHQHKTKLPDSIIAATAKYHQLELLTLDKKLAAKL
ncbi:type II toxin-antitoxin system VapC family toxin [Candidatus Albibeggiatoa sp. nov. NOAA]|uniref:type II toxin-antitoxin system VapC family toxin n=1 Tax=Candidatus Albibeggiatoa sp. nov. NOAA TaxID=3162724 RepID=UPI0032F12006|nr:type II toxin-antitoxin system VapC family toxin [Thiotrichaceae bacterium]